jgi:hypothetical protein
LEPPGHAEQATEFPRIQPSPPTISDPELPLLGCWLDSTGRDFRQRRAIIRLAVHDEIDSKQKNALVDWRQGIWNRSEALPWPCSREGADLLPVD